MPPITTRRPLRSPAFTVLDGLQRPVLLCAVPRLVATVGLEPTCPVPHCSVGLPHKRVCRLPITGTLHHKKCRRISSAVWCTRQESNLQSFRKSAFEAAAYAGFATGAYKCTGHVADHGRCSRKGGADYSCRRLPGRLVWEEGCADICPDIHYTHFTP